MDTRLKPVIERLAAGNCTLVIENGGEMHDFSGRGVGDLFRLLHQMPECLRGACVADKVVGRAAAALMIAGGIRALHTRVVSRLALDLFTRCGATIEVNADVVVDHVINRTQTDWCPLERRCADAQTVEACLERIDIFMNELRMKEKI